MHQIDWCKGGLKLEYIATDNLRVNGLDTRIKYNMVRIEN